jgi:replicative DNA helicase
VPKKEKQDNPQLPAAPDVERAVLAAVLLNDLAYHELVAFGLKPDHFTEERNRKIFRVMQKLVQDHTQAIDFTILWDALQKAGELESVGGMAYVSSLTDGAVDLVRLRLVQSRVEILREKYFRRQVIAVANRSVACAVDPSDPIKFTVAALQEDLLRMQGDVTQEGHSLADFSSEVLAELREQMYSDREIVGLPFFIAELDEVTTGMRAGELIIGGGMPGSGKSSFALDVARKNAKQGTPVAIFSIEMTKEQILHRLWSQESDISYPKMRNPKNMMRQEFRELEERWKPAVDALPLIIDDQARDISEIIPRAHLYMRRNGMKLLVVDYLQLIQAPGDKEYDRVSHAVDALTAFAKTTGVPVLCLSQLTRPEDKKNAANIPPTMSMLRSSGRIEQNANLIIFTHRPEDDTGSPTGEDLLILAKQRAGVKGRIKAHFDGRVQTWGERGIPEAPDPQAKIFDSKSKVEEPF